PPPKKIGQRMKDIKNISTIITNTLKQKLSLSPQKSLTKIQDEVPDEYIFTLRRNGPIII
ncbi:TPA: hypothetical protein ACI7FU_005060, partial [Escherichia coli]